MGGKKLNIKVGWLENSSPWYHGLHSHLHGQIKKLNVIYWV